MQSYPHVPTYFLRSGLNGLLNKVESLNIEKRTNGSFIKENRIWDNCKSFLYDKSHSVLSFNYSWTSVLRVGGKRIFGGVSSSKWVFGVVNETSLWTPFDRDKKMARLRETALFYTHTWRKVSNKVTGPFSILSNKCVVRKSTHFCYTYLRHGSNLSNLKRWDIGLYIYLFIKVRLKSF